MVYEEHEEHVMILKMEIEEIKKKGFEIIYMDTSCNYLVKCVNFHSENPLESQCVKDSSFGFCVGCKFNGGK